MPDIMPCCMGSTIVEEYLGWRCRVCGTLYPHGCEPWGPVDDGSLPLDDDTGLDPLVARECGLWDVYDAAPCPWCGEPACNGTCTGALLADEAAGEDTP